MNMEHNSEEYLHAFAEVTKIAFENRIRYAGDPEVKGPPLDMLLSEDYWNEMAGSIDPDKVMPFEYPGIDHEESMNTTHFVIADKFGNIVCATQTLGNAFGSRIMPEGTGIWLNNSLRYCTFEPAGNAMDAHAGRHKLSGDCPTIIFKDGRPVVAVGTPGGHTIGQNIPQIVMNIIDFNMNLYDAIEAPKMCFVEPDLLQFEKGISEKIKNNLIGLGHNVDKNRYGIGNAHGLVINYDEEGNITGFTGVSDPRLTGSAKGY
jgi:gamma-glutamyltranspeptidase/glutathione hydrolase